VFWLGFHRFVPNTIPPRPDATLRKAAEAFEAVFLAEMLAHAGLGRMPEGFGGGSGESAFSSFLTRAYAEKLAAGGRFGLAEAIVRSATPGSLVPQAGPSTVKGQSND
jgi:peptidoglycan hydrolase FlgJ